MTLCVAALFLYLALSGSCHASPAVTPSPSPNPSPAPKPSSTPTPASEGPFELFPKTSSFSPMHIRLATGEPERIVVRIRNNLVTGVNVTVDDVRTNTIDPVTGARSPFYLAAGASLEVQCSFTGRRLPDPILIVFFSSTKPAYSTRLWLNVTVVEQPRFNFVLPPIASRPAELRQVRPLEVSPELSLILPNRRLLERPSSYPEPILAPTAFRIKNAGSRPMSYQIQPPPEQPCWLQLIGLQSHTLLPQAYEQYYINIDAGCLNLIAISGVFKLPFSSNVADVITMGNGSLSFYFEYPGGIKPVPRPEAFFTDSEKPSARAPGPIVAIVPISSLTLAADASTILEPGRIVAVRWTQISGPPVVIIRERSNYTDIEGGISNTGVYVFQLACTDELSGVASSNITVLASVRGVSVRIALDHPFRQVAKDVYETETPDPKVYSLKTPDNLVFFVQAIARLVEVDMETEWKRISALRMVPFDPDNRSPPVYSATMLSFNVVASKEDKATSMRQRLAALTPQDVLLKIGYRTLSAGPTMLLNPRTDLVETTFAADEELASPLPADYRFLFRKARLHPGVVFLVGFIGMTSVALVTLIGLKTWNWNEQRVLRQSAIKPNVKRVALPR